MTKRTKTLNFCSLFFVLYSLNRIFASSNQFNHINIIQNNKTMKLSKLWVLAGTLICVASLFTACSKDDDKSNQVDNLPEKIIGKWINVVDDGYDTPTNQKIVLTFLSSTKAQFSLSAFSPATSGWVPHQDCNVTFKGNKATVTTQAFGMLYTCEYTIHSISDKEMDVDYTQNYSLNGQVLREIHGVEHFLRMDVDYTQEILGTWEGRSTGAETSEFDDGEDHRWEYLADGTFRYYHKVNGQWQLSNDEYANYFVDGHLLCTRWKNVGEGMEEHREWWEIESLKNGMMKWKALRMREDGSTYIATFQMNKVQ